LNLLLSSISSLLGSI